MAYSMFRRVPARSRPKSRYGAVQKKGFAAPVSGLVTNENLATQRPGGAIILDDCFPEANTVRLRSGQDKWATVGAGKVERIMAYRGGATKKMFACHGGGIFNITTPVDAVTIPAADVSGLLGNTWSYVNFSTSGGAFLVAVNGVDDMRHYDGTTWAAINATSSPAITGIATASLNHVNVFKNRIFLVEKDSLNVWFLPINSIAGAAQSLSLSGVFQKGGSVLFTATWSIDSGSGLDDKFVVVSDNGEAAIYEGTDPASASAWGLVGVYDVTPPLGRDAWIKSGGDLLIATSDGLIPISSAVTKDPTTLALSAVSNPIKPNWDDIKPRATVQPFEVLAWPEKGMGIVTAPVAPGSADLMMLVVNLRTGSWARYRNWDALTLAHHDGWVYFGTHTGTIHRAEIGATDDGAIYYPTIAWSWDHLNDFGDLKTVRQARATLRSAVPSDPLIGVSTDYISALGNVTGQTGQTGGPGLWDSGLWDVAQWDDASNQTIATTQWVSIAKTGTVFSPSLQFAVSGDTPPNLDVVELALLYEVGGIVT